MLSNYRAILFDFLTLQSIFFSCPKTNSWNASMLPFSSLAQILCCGEPFKKLAWNLLLTLSFPCTLN